VARFTLTLNCPERAGIVHAVTSFLVDHGCDIVEQSVVRRSAPARWTRRPGSA
jgi:formyltetrahydrofolate hydrolase